MAEKNRQTTPQGLVQIALPPLDILPFPGIDGGEIGGPEQRGASVSVVSLCVAVVLVVAIFPLLVALLVAVRASSRGAALYCQRRVGLHGAVYTMYKIRSMRQDAESRGAVWAARRDSRVTPIGRWLRWSHFDELPQLFNILRGEMAFVGPRPERPEFVDKLAARLPGYRDRLAIKPGITGLSQVNLPPDESIETVRKKLVFDRYYIEHASASMNVRIIVATALRLLGVRYDRGARWLSIDPYSLEGFPVHELVEQPTPLRAAA